MLGWLLRMGWEPDQAKIDRLFKVMVHPDHKIDQRRRGGLMKHHGGLYPDRVKSKVLTSTEELDDEAEDHRPRALRPQGRSV